jgi:DNA modification methylase
MIVEFSGVKLRQGSAKIMTGDCEALLKALPVNAIDCCITSPPYLGLRDYGHPGQIGLEDTPQKYVAKIVEVFRLIRQALKDDGTVWLNIGDSYARIGSDGACGANARVGNTRSGEQRRNCTPPPGLKNKDMFCIPWRLALALQDDGWYLRSDIIWHKTNAMPESVTDRPTKSHEYLFLLSKSEKYFFDAEAVKEPHSTIEGTFRNKRSVWSIPTKPFKGAHFATMPAELVEPCVLAGTSAKGHCPICGLRWRRDHAMNWRQSCQCDATPVPDVVLDPFGGAGTTALVAGRLGRNTILMELMPDYAKIAQERLLSAVMRENPTEIAVDEVLHAPHQGNLPFPDAACDGVLE